MPLIKVHKKTIIAIDKIAKILLSVIANRGLVDIGMEGMQS